MESQESLQEGVRRSERREDALRLAWKVEEGAVSRGL